jgi:hypothetical protein
MAQVGCLGDVIFTMSKEKMETINDMIWSSGAKWEEHNRHLMEPLLEFAGREADEISFTIHLSVFLGVDPMEEITRLFEYERNGTLLPMILGEHSYGKYRWVIVSTQRTLNHFDGAGDLISADVDLSLKSYVK